METQIPIHEMYKQRQSFVIVALTGISGSGCSSFAKMMCTPFDAWEAESYRSMENIYQTVESNSKRNEVFKREYQTVYNFFAKNYQPYIAIKYRNVLFLYMCCYLARQCKDFPSFLSNLQIVLEDKFCHKHEDKDHVEQVYEYDPRFSNEELIQNGVDEGLYLTLKELDFTHRKELAQVFFNDDFSSRCDRFYEMMRGRDYYSKTFFVHRLASSIRATGDPRKKFDEYTGTIDTTNLFAVVELIVGLIKGYHQLDRNAHRRFVIDSVRNSMELLYLRERYNSFYAIAIHNDKKEKDLLVSKVSKYQQDPDILNRIVSNMMRLSNVELKTDDFEKGRLYAQDLAKCITDSEIHIAYKPLNALDEEQRQLRDDSIKLSFYSYAEQWMKFASLILRPGLITPSSDERNMSIAYVAKFNSGCISRQVGCAIVDAENSIQSIGWNDPPSEQLPCNLRYANELLAHQSNGKYEIFSRFEIEDDGKYTFKLNEDAKDEADMEVKGGLRACLHTDIPEPCWAIVEKEGLPYPYCFRSRYNKYRSNKDQVNTRSLHAEENTMLRISRVGGMGLKGGTMYVTAAPCVLCSKKAYQIGIKDIVYLDPYTDIAPRLVLSCGYRQPNLRPFRGAVGGAFYKLYQPFMPVKDELNIYELLNRKK